MKKVELPKADDLAARVRSNIDRKEIHEWNSYLEPIQERICEAVEANLYSIWINWSLPQHIESYLTDLGYIVTERDEKCLVISWWRKRNG